MEDDKNGKTRNFLQNGGRINSCSSAASSGIFIIHGVTRLIIEGGAIQHLGFKTFISLKMGVGDKRGLGGITPSWSVLKKF